MSKKDIVKSVREGFEPENPPRKSATDLNSNHWTLIDNWNGASIINSWGNFFSQGHQKHSKSPMKFLYVLFLSDQEKETVDRNSTGVSPHLILMLARLEELKMH